MFCPCWIYPQEGRALPDVFDLVKKLLSSESETHGCLDVSFGSAPDKRSNVNNLFHNYLIPLTIAVWLTGSFAAMLSWLATGTYHYYRDLIDISDVHSAYILSLNRILRRPIPGALPS